MNISRRRVLLWIKPFAAAILLGSPSQRKKLSRWVLHGTLDDDPDNAHGLWLHIDALDERGAGKRCEKVLSTWAVKPRTCLVRWDWILIFQVFDADERDAGRIGFRSADDDEAA